MDVSTDFHINNMMVHSMVGKALKMLMLDYSNHMAHN